MTETENYDYNVTVRMTNGDVYVLKNRDHQFIELVVDFDINEWVMVCLEYPDYTGSGDIKELYLKRSEIVSLEYNRTRKSVSLQRRKGEEK